ncbi:MAG: response regulator [Deltaproteobacteria bacterium HGW-Deltaproteobacteria-9]|nr:MAG: response regulator [Deltaproteobacteria bacterium HGW-Deltaproteobacteria-9]
MRILIAEDDFTSRTMLAAVLKKGGDDVVETANGLEAWNEIQKPDAPRLAIFDWMMPEMDGLEIVRRIRALESDQTTSPDSPATADRHYLIMLTTRDDKSDIIAGLNTGADDYLAKPFDPGELRARVEAGRRMLNMQKQLAEQIRELKQALDHIKTLQGILPICSFCKKIRDDGGYWNQVEAYISRHSDAMFSHSICPECMKKHYSEFVKDSDSDS